MLNQTLPILDLEALHLNLRRHRLDWIWERRNDSIAQLTIDGFDVAIVARRDTDLDAFQAAGATWAMHAVSPGRRPDQVLRLMERGPAT